MTKDTRLEDYQDAVRGMSHEDSQTFAHVFIGALSWHASAEQWSRCLKSAKKVMEERKLNLIPDPLEVK